MLEKRSGTRELAREPHARKLGAQEGENGGGVRGTQRGEVDVYSKPQKLDSSRLIWLMRHEVLGLLGSAGAW